MVQYQEISLSRPGSMVDDGDDESSPARPPASWRQSIMSGLRTVGLWFPVAFMMAIMIFSYYVYIVTFCTLFLIYGDPSYKTRGALYIVTFNLLMVIFLWAFINTIRTDPGKPSDYPNLILGDRVEDGFEDPRPLQRAGQTVLPGSYSRYCNSCSYIKPDRCHHCSVCKRCALKMDHHCVWLNSCVGHQNYKLFVLTLVYGVLLGLFMNITMAQQMIYDAANGSLFLNEIQMIIAFGLTFALSLAALALLIFHVYLAWKNQTTIESLDEKERAEIHRKIQGHRRKHGVAESSPRPDPKFNPYRLDSAMENFKAAWGHHVWLWPVPIRDKTIGDGIWFPRKPEPEG